MQRTIQESTFEDNPSSEEELSFENIIKAVKRLEIAGAGSRLTSFDWGES